MTIPAPRWQSHCQGQRLSLLAPKPLHSSSRRDPTDPTHSHTSFARRLHPRFPTAESRMSRSIKAFIPSAVTQAQPELVPLRRSPAQEPRTFIAFIPHLLSARKSRLALRLPPPSPCPSPRWHHPVSFVNQKIGDSRLLLCLSVSIHLAGIPHLRAFCYPKGWHFTASCLGPPPAAQSASQSPV